jgi:hypothetical protein
MSLVLTPKHIALMIYYNKTWNLVVISDIHTFSVCKQFLCCLCDGPFSEASFRGWRVYKYDLETSTMRRPTPEKGSCATRIRNSVLLVQHILRRSCVAQ